MSYSLSPETEQLVASHLAAGGYATADELITDALAALDSLKARHAELKASIQRRLASTEPGKPLDFNELKAEVRKRLSLRTFE